MHVYLTDRVNTKAGCPGIDLSTMWKYVRAPNFFTNEGLNVLQTVKKLIKLS